VRGLFSDNDGCYDRMVAKVPLKVQRFSVFLISFILMATALTFSIKGSIFWSQVVPYYEFFNKDTGDFVHIGAAREMNSGWIIGMLWALSGMILFYYLHMRHVLNKFFADSL